jgi:hypothetical protein
MFYPKLSNILNPFYTQQTYEQIPYLKSNLFKHLKAGINSCVLDEVAPCASGCLSGGPVSRRWQPSRGSTSC